MDKKFGLIIDLGGTLIIGDSLTYGAKELLDYLHTSNIPYVILTNDSTKSPKDWSVFLSQHSLKIPPEKVITASTIIAEYFDLYVSKNKEIYLLGGDALKQTFIEKGYKISIEPKENDVVVMGFDENFSFQTIKKACQLVSKGADFYITNPDRLSYFKRKIVPGTGSISKVIETATSITPIALGKPSKFAFEFALNKIGISKDSAIVVGDNIEIDMMGGKLIGSTTVLIKNDLIFHNGISNISADYSFESLNLFLEYLKINLGNNI